MWEGPTEYEQVLTKEIFDKCVNILVNLPLSEDEPNMITIRKQKEVSQHPYIQIMNDTIDGKSCWWRSDAGHYSNIRGMKLEKYLYNGKYMIEMTNGCDYVKIA